MRILLVEPDVGLADIYIQALKNAQHIVDWVQTANKAIHTADQQKPDVVVLELQLAQHSGVAFLQEFRSYTDWSDVPIVLHTMVPPSQLRVFQRSLKEMGVCAQLYKPQTSLGQLIQTINRCNIVETV